MNNQYLPENDGVDHINVYSKSNIILGRVLSHFYHAPFTIPAFGSFNTIEGFWHYISTGMKHEEYRYQSGIACKIKSKQHIKVMMNEDEFKELIHMANIAKFKQNEKLGRLLAMSTLPLDHYYVYGTKQVRAEAHAWTINMYEEVRKEMKAYYGIT